MLKSLIDALLKVQVSGLEKLDLSGPTIIIPNHQSFLDGLILALRLDKKVQFVINTEVAERMSLMLKLTGRTYITVDPRNPYSVRTMINAVNDGIPLVIFPEGRITRTGGLMKVYSGTGYIAMKTGAKLYPVALTGLERSKFSYMKELMKRTWFPDVTVKVCDPFTVHREEDVPMKQQRKNWSSLILRKLQEAQFSARLKSGVNLYNELVDAGHRNGMDKIICEDPIKPQQKDDEKKQSKKGKGEKEKKAPVNRLTYKKFILSVNALSNRLVKILDNEDRVGVLLPTSVGHAATLFALFRTSITPAELNYSNGPEALLGYCETAELETVLTSRAFIASSDKIPPLIKALETKTKVRILYLEDIKEQISFGDKAAAMTDYVTGTRCGLMNNELILFTSGSESRPKGVVLTHNNVYANIQQSLSLIDITPKDVMFNAMPLFHSLGLTVGCILPLLSGLMVHLFPNPLAYKQIPEYVYDRSCTIMFGTNTFLAGYAKQADDYDFFYKLRYVIVGGEKLKDDVRDTYLRRFETRILEGYGATETAPILALNTPLAFKEGTVGRILPGIETKLEPVDGVSYDDRTGKLLVKGPNVLKGYLKHGVGFEKASEWYDTGDIVNIDEKGFVSIVGRVKRFAKIGGEMVSLNVVEEMAVKCFDVESTEVAAVNIPDERKGERIVLFTIHPYLPLKFMNDYLTEHGHSPIMLPSRIVYVDKMPILGPGKIDYQTLKQMAISGAPSVPSFDGEKLDYQDVLKKVEEPLSRGSDRIVRTKLAASK